MESLKVGGSIVYCVVEEVCSISDVDVVANDFNAKMLEIKGILRFALYPFAEGKRHY